MLSSEMTQWRNDLPGLMTLQECCRVPVSGLSSLQVQTLRVSHSDTDCTRHCSLSSGRRSWPCRVSTIIPNMITGLGPFLFSVANRTPKYSHS